MLEFQNTLTVYFAFRAGRRDGGTTVQGQAVAVTALARNIAWFGTKPADDPGGEIINRKHEQQPQP